MKKALLLLILALAACGAQADTSDGRLACSEEPAEKFVVGEADVAEDGAIVTAEDSVEKFSLFNIGGQNWRIPTGYGQSLYAPFPTGAFARCSQDLSSWQGDCRAPTDRHMRIAIDISPCIGVGSSWAFAFRNAVYEFRDYARSNLGWDITTDPVGAEILASCQAPANPNSTGTHQSGPLTCYNLPNRPRDMCFMTAPYASRYVRVDVAYIAAATYLGIGQRETRIRNVTFHELMHAIGFGHDTVAGDTLMAEFEGSATYSGKLWPDATEVQAARDFNHGATGNLKCNWLPGDPVGDSCPNQ